MRKTILLYALALALAIPAAGLFGAKAATREAEPSYNGYAWLEELYAREPSGGYRLCTFVPVTSNPYSRTCEEFKREVAQMTAAYPIENNAVEQGYYALLKTAASTAQAAGATDDYERQKQWLESEAGIVFPAAETEDTRLYATVLYAALKYPSASALAGKTLDIPRGTSLEKAVVIYIDTVTDAGGRVPETRADNLREYAAESMRVTLMKNGYAVDDSTGYDYIERLYTVYLIRKSGYQIDSDAPDAQINSYYFAVLINQKYGVMVAPAPLAAALGQAEGERAKAVQILILRSMAQEKGGAVSAGMSVEEAFEKVRSMGWFALKDGFYSDIYSYNVNMQYKNDYIYLTPVSYLGHRNSAAAAYVTITFNGVKVPDKTPVKVALDSTKASGNVEIAVTYAKGSVFSEKTYQVKFIQGTGTSGPPATTLPGLTAYVPSTRADTLPGGYTTYSDPYSDYSTGLFETQTDASGNPVLTAADTGTDLSGNETTSRSGTHNNEDGQGTDMLRGRFTLIIAAAGGAAGVAAVVLLTVKKRRNNR